MNIKFRPMHEQHKYTFQIQPSSKHIPDWYKKMPLFFDNPGTVLTGGNGNIETNLTVKACSPFFDTFLSGYMVTTNAEIEFSLENNQETVRWRNPVDLLSSHNIVQLGDMPAPVDCSSEVFKWIFYYRIETPKGYSCIFTHPLNRHDLPFRTFSGIVETDSYVLPVQFPFQFIKPNTKSFILPIGTPIVQVIPFKRENWKSEKLEYDKQIENNGKYELFKKVFRSYKTQYWQKKTYV